MLLLRIPRYSGKVLEKRRRREAITKLSAFQANAITKKKELKEKQQ